MVVLPFFVMLFPHHGDINVVFEAGWGSGCGAILIFNHYFPAVSMLKIVKNVNTKSIWIPITIFPLVKMIDDAFDLSHTNLGSMSFLRTSRRASV